jgi:ABC-type lipoprotein export system ATPase subunit
MFSPEQPLKRRPRMLLPNASGAQSTRSHPAFVLHRVGRSFNGRGGVFIENLEIPRNGLVAVLGASGSGKSTLLHLLAGLTSPAPADQMRFEAHVRDALSQEVGCFDLAKRITQSYRDQLGFVFQSPHLIQDGPASTNIALGQAASGALTAVTAVAEAAYEVGLTVEHLVRRCNVLSGGERQRVSLARAFVRRPSVILADEPTASLDPILSATVMDLMKAWVHAAPDRVLVWVTHDVHLVAAYADQIIVLCDGHLQVGKYWPVKNPRDPQLLREWICGSVRQRLAASDSSGVGRSVSPLDVWCRIGFSQVFAKATVDTGWAARVANVLPRSLLRRTPAQTRARWGYSHWLSSLLLGPFIGMFAVFYCVADRVPENFRLQLDRPSRNPVVVAVEDSIPEGVISNARKRAKEQFKQAGIDEEAALRLFGRYEMEVGAQPSKDQACSGRASLTTITVGFLDREERVLSQLWPAYESESGLDPSPYGSQLPKAIVAASLPERLSAGPPAMESAAAHLFCVDRLLPPDATSVGDRMRPVEIVAQMSEPPRNRRFDRYDAFMSSVLYEKANKSTKGFHTVAFYFAPDFTRARHIFDAITRLASTADDAKNEEEKHATLLFAALTAQASYESIVKDFELASKNIMLAEVLQVIVTALAILLVVFVNVELLRKNEKSLAVTGALGARLGNLMVVQTILALGIGTPAVLIGLIFFAGAMYVIIPMWPDLRSFSLPDSLSALFSYGLVAFYALTLIAFLSAVSAWFFGLTKLRSGNLATLLKEVE